MDVFPVTVNCDPSKGWSNPDFRPYFNRAKPQTMTWYAYDVIITAPTSVRFQVYDMADPVYGGIGEVVGIFEVAVPSDVTRKYIIDKALWIAAKLRLQELERIEDEAVGHITETILTKVYK